MNKLTVSAPPYEKSAVTTQKIMACVLISLMPASAAAVYIFGISSAILISVCILACVIFEYLTRIIMKRSRTISDLSAAVTGLLLAFNLPPTLPVWQAIIGCFIAIVIVKQLFGGLGQNFANPAITARIALMMSFASSMTKFAEPFFYRRGADAITSPTPLASEGVSLYRELFLGFRGGCLGETCIIALLIGGIFLIAMRVITPTIPLSFIGTVSLLFFLLGDDPLYQVMSGGLVLGAFFMATDYTTSPITEKGKLIFGIGCGVITVVIRQFAGTPEGVSFAILLMNILTPYIDRFTIKKPFGIIKKEGSGNGKA